MIRNNLIAYLTVQTRSRSYLNRRREAKNFNCKNNKAIGYLRNKDRRSTVIVRIMKMW
jgi:hypothetical protein